MRRSSASFFSLIVATNALVAASFAAAPAATAADCGPRPGGGYVHAFSTLDRSPARTGPYESCSVARTYAAGSSVQLACWLTNTYGNVWYKVYPTNTFIYSDHFRAGVKNQIDNC